MKREKSKKLWRVNMSSYPKGCNLRAYPNDVNYINSLRIGKERQADVIKRILKKIKTDGAEKK